MTFSADLHESGCQSVVQFEHGGGSVRCGVICRNIPIFKGHYDLTVIARWGHRVGRTKVFPSPDIALINIHDMNLSILIHNHQIIFE